MKNWVAAAAAVAIIMTLGSYSRSAAAQKAAVSAAGGVITVKGMEDQISSPVKIEAGVYIVRRVSGEGFMSFSVNDSAGETVYATMLKGTGGTFLLIVGGNPLKPGDVVFDISSMGAWTMTATKVEASGAVAMPLVLTGAEMSEAISPPFKAAAGNIVMSYTFKGKPKGTGTLTICDVATGKTLRHPGMMSAAIISGGWNIAVPAAGVYIAHVTFPLASGGGEVKLSQ